MGIGVVKIKTATRVVSSPGMPCSPAAADTWQQHEFSVNVDERLAEINRTKSRLKRERLIENLKIVLKSGGYDGILMQLDGMGY